MTRIAPVLRLATLAAAVAAALLAGCGKKEDPDRASPEEGRARQRAGTRRRAGPRHRGSQGHRRGRLHLRPADRHELRGDVRVRDRQELGPVQGAVQPDLQRGPRLHLQGHGDRHAQQRHALLAAVDGPARRADGAVGAGGGQEALLLGAADRRQHLQLRLHRQPRHRQRGRRLPGRRPELEGRDAAGHQEGVPLEHRLLARHLPHPALRTPRTCPTSRRCRRATRRSRCRRT